MNPKMGILAIVLVHVGIVMFGFAMLGLGGDEGDPPWVVRVQELCLLTWPAPIYIGVRIWRRYKP